MCLPRLKTERLAAAGTVCMVLGPWHTHARRPLQDIGFLPSDLPIAPEEQGPIVMTIQCATKSNHKLALCHINGMFNF